MAAVILHPGQQLTESELLGFCEPRLPYFAVPRYLEFMNELPSTESGKVQKYKLRERGVTERTWDRDASDGSHTRATQTQESGRLHNRNGAAIRSDRPPDFRDAAYFSQSCTCWLPQTLPCHRYARYDKLARTFLAGVQ